VVVYGPPQDRERLRRARSSSGSSGRPRRRSPRPNSWRS